MLAVSLSATRLLRPAAVVPLLCSLALSLSLIARHWRRSRLPLRFELERILRPCVLRLKPYVFPPRFDLGSSPPVLLDANENPHGCTVEPKHALGVQLHRYPDPRQKLLKESIARLRGCLPGQILLGVGSDELIDLLIRVACAPGRDAILICSPTYAMYSIFGAINDVATLDVPLSPGDYQLRVAEVVRALRPRVKLVFLCSPGNPSSRLLRRADIEAIAAAATGALVVVDEAYIDYADASASCVGLVGALHNVVVIQTFSKAWGLAGARVGVAIAPEALVRVMDRCRASWLKVAPNY